VAEAAPTEDEWLVSEPRLERFVADVRAIFRTQAPIEQRLSAAEPVFRELLLTDGWLPPDFQHGDPASGMGGGIGTWLLYRSAERDLSLFALVVDPGSATPVHDHLAWGLIGLYRGRQREAVFRHRHGAPSIQLADERDLDRGGIYHLIPPEGDIHAVSTISPEPSISIHLLGSDIGCIWRHRYDLDAGTVHDFRSGYSNRACEEAASEQA
jgi:predicted metal-dependent enzyme (double-stranded beta helix superfamily)